MIAYLLPIVAVFFGFGLVYFIQPFNQKSIKLLLSFSGGFLLSVTIFNLLPEIFEDHDHAKSTGVFIMAGILLQIFLEFFSKGAEHGHVHLSSNSKEFPTVLLISLFIHAVLEGFPIHQTHGLLAGIIVHKIPVAMILSLFLLKSALSKPSVIAFLILFALATPVGSFIAEKFEVLIDYYTQITAVVVGIFLHISTTILFESSEGHKFNVAKMASIILAISIAYFI